MRPGLPQSGHPVARLNESSADNERDHTGRDGTGYAHPQGSCLTQFEGIYEIVRDRYGFMERSPQAHEIQTGFPVPSKSCLPSRGRDDAAKPLCFAGGMSALHYMMHRRPSSGISFSR